MKPIRTPTMSARLTLDMAAMQEDFFADTALIGIASALPGYRLCWMLNQKFDLEFVRDPKSDICIHDANNEEHYFSIYKYCTPLNGNKYLLYKLKSDKETLLPEIRQLDYLWMIQSNTPEADAGHLTQYLRDIPDIQLAQVIQPEKLKHLSYLLL
jgi:hypothetical protein